MNHEAGNGTAPPGSTAHIPATFVTQGRLARVRGQNILFSPSQRAIFAVNDTAAEIWRSLEEGTSPRAISAEMARAGVDGIEANRHVEAALRDWQRLSLIRPDAPPSVSAREAVSQVVAIAGLSVRIEYPAACAFPAVAVFRHLEVRRETADILFQLVEHEGRVHLFRDGDWVLSCAPDELPVMVKGQMLIEVLDRSAYELALHAAALLKNERIVLLCGNPGAGKTTLTLALVNAGFG
ncbi:MAG: PqqD family peptide modification chaperone, partial [Mesorhizobium sp.]